MKQVQKPKKPIIFYYVIALIVILLLNLLLFPRLLEPKVTEVDYGKFLQMVDNNEISKQRPSKKPNIVTDSVKSRSSQMRLFSATNQARRIIIRRV